MKHYNYILIASLLFILTSCGISEDCFKGNGNQITQSFPLDNFTKIKVYDGVGLVVKEGPNYEVKVKTSDNIIDDLDVRIDGDMLVVKDNSTCNIARDYGQTVVYVTAPSLEEIHCKTDQDIRSDGVLHYSNLRLYSIDLSDGAGTGNFQLKIENEFLYIESNNVSNFKIDGKTNSLVVFFSWGNGQFKGENLIANEIEVFHRGSNDMILNPVQSLKGNLYSTGNVFLRNNPIILNVNELFTGKIFFL